MGTNDEVVTAQFNGPHYNCSPRLEVLHLQENAALRELEPFNAYV
jgi:hypothetical protein